LEAVLARFEERLKPRFYSDKVEFARALQRGRRILTEYYNANFPVVGRQVADLERPFAIPLNETDADPAHSLSGRIDRIDYIPASDTYEVIDYKTGWRMPAANLASDSLQLAIYEEAVRRLYNTERVVVSLYHVEHLKKQEVTRQSESWPVSREKILETVAKIDSEMFDPRPGSHCQTCFHQKNCPMWIHKFKEEVGLDDTVTAERVSASELAEHYITLHQQTKLLEAALEALKTQLHNAMDELQVEALFCPAGSVSRRSSERAEYDARLAAEFLRTSSALPDVISLAKTTITRLARDGFLSREQVAQLEREKKIKLVRSLSVKLADENDEEDTS
jgi:hypothetical protein